MITTKMIEVEVLKCDHCNDEVEPTDHIYISDIYPNRPRQHLHFCTYNCFWTYLLTNAGIEFEKESIPMRSIFLFDYYTDED